ncbi:MAG: hypothetical protein NT145_01900, partial [Elusimicrobia bacterium]|nr:hypothetical protein [Elusimicrobiota bacterium]
QKISYCIDESNFKLDFTRNRIRHEILSKLKKYNKKTVEHLFNLSKIVASENEFLNVFTNKALKKSAKFGIDKISLDLNEFFRYNKTIQYRILKRILPEKISLLNIEKVFDFLVDSKKNHIDLSGTWKVRKNNQKSYFLKVQ